MSARRHHLHNCHRHNAPTFVIRNPCFLNTDFGCTVALIIFASSSLHIKIHLKKNPEVSRKTRQCLIGNQIPWSWCFSHFLNTDFGCTENRKTRRDLCTMIMRVMESWSWNFSHFLNTDFGCTDNRKTMESWSWYFSHFLNMDFGCTENWKTKRDPCTMTMRVMESWSWYFSHFLEI
jgi:hypothetical protein